MENKFRDLTIVAKQWLELKSILGTPHVAFNTEAVFSFIYFFHSFSVPKHGFYFLKT